MKSLRTLVASLIVLSLLYLPGKSQDLSGSWKGIFHSNLDGHGRPRTLTMVMELKENGRNLEGSFANLSEKMEVNVRYQVSGITGKKKKFPFSLMRGKLLVDNLPEGVAQVFREFYDIQYLATDSVEYLFGRWNGMTGQDHGYFQVARKNTIAQKLSLPATRLSYPERRSSENLINTSSQKVDLAFFDNGEIDGDTISVYVNDIRVVHNQRLSATAIHLQLDIPASGILKVSVFAENLGSIPPNTGVVVLKSGEINKTLFLSSDFESNATIIFKLKEH